MDKNKTILVILKLCSITKYTVIGRSLSKVMSCIAVAYRKHRN